MRRRRNPETIGGLIGQNGTVTFGEATVIKGAAGIYDLTFPPDLTLVAFVATAHSGSAHIASATNRTGSTIRVVIYTNAGVAIDAPFSYIAQGARA